LIELLKLKVLAIKADCPQVKWEEGKLYFTLLNCRELPLVKKMALEEMLGRKILFSPYQLMIPEVIEDPIKFTRKVLRLLSE